MKLLKLVPDHTNLDFMRWRNVALVISLIATIASIAFTAYRGLNLGVDFVGGQLVRVTFAQPVDVEQLRAKVDATCIDPKDRTDAKGNRLITFCVDRVNELQPVRLIKIQPAADKAVRVRK